MGSRNSCSQSESTRNSCHIRVWFEDYRIELNYQDDRAVATHFAAAAAGSGATVTIDSDLRDDLPSLPCRRLWT